MDFRLALRVAVVMGAFGYAQTSSAKRTVTWAKRTDKEQVLSCPYEDAVEKIGRRVLNRQNFGAGQTQAVAGFKLGGRNGQVWVERKNDCESVATVMVDPERSWKKDVGGREQRYIEDIAERKLSAVRLATRDCSNKRCLAEKAAAADAIKREKLRQAELARQKKEAQRQRAERATAEREQANKQAAARAAESWRLCASAGWSLDDKALKALPYPLKAVIDNEIPTELAHTYKLIKSTMSRERSGPQLSGTYQYNNRYGQTERHRFVCTISCTRTRVTIHACKDPVLARTFCRAHGLWSCDYH